MSSKRADKNYKNQDFVQIFIICDSYDYQQVWNDTEGL